MANYGVIHIDELAETSDGRVPYRPVRHHFGIDTFGATAWVGKAPGDRLINEHSESGPDSGDELYVVLNGHATFELDGTSHDAPTGTFVHAGAGVNRTAFAKEAGTTVLAIGAGAPGRAYEPQDWEAWGPLFELFDEQRYEEMIERARPMLEPQPKLTNLYYNVACAESLSGHENDAVAHLRTAIELKPALAELAREDEDFVALRERPDFVALIAS